MAGAGRPGAGAVRYRLRDGEPARRLAGDARSSTARPGCTGWSRTSGRSAPRCSSPPRATRPTRGSSSSRRGRTRRRRTTRRSSPVALGLPAGPGQRPGGPRRLGLDEVARRSGLERVDVDPAPRGRRVERPARAARGVAARGGGPDRGGTPRPGADRQRARRRRGREPGAAAVPAGGVRGAARRAAAPRLGADLVVRRPALARAGPGPARRRSRCAPSTGPSSRRAGAALAARARPSGSSPPRTASSGRSGCRCRRRRPGAPAAGCTGVATPRPMTLRTFTLRYGSAYRPLVGGLANVFETHGPRRRAGRRARTSGCSRSRPATPTSGSPTCCR